MIFAIVQIKLNRAKIKVFFPGTFIRSVILTAIQHLSEETPEIFYFANHHYIFLH